MTGAGGYIGAHVVDALARRRADVVAVARHGAPTPASPAAAAVRWVEGDIFEGDLLERTGPVDVCLHLAWEAGFVHNDPVHMLRLSDHFRFLTGLSDAGVGHIAVLGTMHEVGYHEGAIDETTPTRPRSLYGVAKNALREALTFSFAASGTTFQWLRCYYIDGDDERSQSVFSKIADAAARGDATFPFTSGTAQYDFIDVDELAEQIAATTLQSTVDGVVNCCSGEPVALGARVEEFIRRRGLDIRLEYGAYPDRAYDSPAVWGDATKIRQILASERASR